MLGSKVVAIRPKIQSNYEEQNIWRGLVLSQSHCEQRKTKFVK